jgi:SAM-dependent methyltransferase
MIYRHLRKQHQEFQAWCTQIEFNSILEVGCGTGLYADFFPTKRYVGVDISETAIISAHEKRGTPIHVFECMDYIADKQLDGMKFDLVFSHSVIDHVYNINEFIRKLFNNTAKYLWITCYNGYFNDLGEHVYEPYDGFYINKISIPRIKAILEPTNAYYEIFPLEYNPNKPPATIIKVIKNSAKSFDSNTDIQ